MTYCVKCGAQVEDGTKFCSYCGEPIPNVFADAEPTYEGEPESDYFYGTEQGAAQDSYENYQQYAQDSEYFAEADLNGHKGMGVLCYLGFLFLIPLLAGDKNSEYLRHHLNQGIALFIVSTLINVADRLLGNVGLISWAADLLDLAVLIVMIMGIVSAVKGTRKPLPFMENIQVFK